MPCFIKYRLILILALLGICFTAIPGWSHNKDYKNLKQQAETFFERDSFSRAHRLYQQASEMNLDKEDMRWVAFRLEDTRWRSASASR